MFLLSALVTTTFDFFSFLTLPYYLFSGESLGFSAHSKERGRPLLWREVAILSFPLRSHPPSSLYDPH